MCQSRYANQITATKTVPQHAAVSAMIGTEAAMVAVGFLSRIGLPHPITSRGHTFACIRPGLGGISSRDGPPSMKACLRQTPRPGPDCVLGFRAPYCGGGRLNPNLKRDICKAWLLDHR